MSLPNLLEEAPLTPGTATPIKYCPQNVFPPFATQPVASTHSSRSKHFAPPFKSFSQQLNLKPKQNKSPSSATGSPPRHSYTQREDIFSKMDQMSSSQGGTQTPLSGAHTNPFTAPQQRLDGCFARILGLDTSANVLREDYNHDMDEIRVTLRHLQNTLQENTNELEQQQDLMNTHRKKGDELRDRVMDLEDSHNVIQGRTKELSELIEQQAQILQMLTNLNNERWTTLTEQHEQSREYIGELVLGVEHRLGEKLEAEMERIRDTVAESAKQSQPVLSFGPKRQHRETTTAPLMLSPPKSPHKSPARKTTAAAPQARQHTAVSLRRIDSRHSEEISVVSSVMSDEMPMYSWSDDLGI